MQARAAAAGGKTPQPELATCLCSYCDREIKFDRRCIGQIVKCDDCGEEITLCVSSPASIPAELATSVCPFCGEKFGFDKRKAGTWSQCKRCGQRVVLSFAPLAALKLESATSTQTQSQAWRENLGPHPDKVAMSPEAKAGLVSELSRWMRHLFVRKLATDRALLMQGQQAAAKQLQTVDERLAALGSQLQAQNAVYEQRIRELTAELNNAKEENRALLLLKIKELKAEMESARARLEQEL